MTLASLLQRSCPPPAVISPTSQRRLRNRRRTLTGWLCLALLYLLALLVWGGGHFVRQPTVTHAMVSRVYAPNTIEPPRLPYGVRASDGQYYYFSSDPQLAPGDALTITHDSSGRLLSIACHGQLVTAGAPSTFPAVASEIVGAALIALMIATTSLAGAGMWMRERQVRADLASDLQTRDVVLQPVRLRAAWLTGTGAVVPFFSRMLRGRDAAGGGRVDLAVRVADVPLLNELIAAGGPLRVSCHPHTGLVVEAETRGGRRLVSTPPADADLGSTFSGRAQWWLLRQVRRMGPGEASWPACSLLSWR